MARRDHRPVCQHERLVGLSGSHTDLLALRDQALIDACRIDPDPAESDLQRGLCALCGSHPDADPRHHAIARVVIVQPRRKIADTVLQRLQVVPHADRVGQCQLNERELVERVGIGAILERCVLGHAAFEGARADLVDERRRAFPCDLTARPHRSSGFINRRHESQA